jgi:hypothetical protein
MDKWIELREKAKELKVRISIMNKEFFTKFQIVHPGKFKSLGALTMAYNKKALPSEVLHYVQDFYNERENTKAEMDEASTMSDRMLEESRKQDKRNLLNPKIDGTPVGEYAKLKQCKTYPLRLSCNYGSDHKCTWNRCEFMKYNSSASIYDSARWICISSE